ncbi:MAG: hypothetical protein MRECE_16c016 [Mycoplasmataceae bacterium CE_OT135]|nr:MAG: hypothetical protein MRECE_16c016 [Mycoplasmataceae bacterium CE_OT135]
MNFKDEYEKFFLEISEPGVDFWKLFEISKKYEKILSFDSLNSLDELEIFFKVQKRQNDILYSFLDEWSKNSFKLSDRELEIFADFMKKTTLQVGSIESFKIANPIIKFAGKEKEADEIKEKAMRNVENFFELFIQHEKERSQSNQPITPKNQSNNNNYPWGIIISMGTVIAGLLGVIIFLLVRKKNKKNE